MGAVVDAGRAIRGRATRVPSAGDPQSRRSDRMARSRGRIDAAQRFDVDDGRDAAARRICARCARAERDGAVSPRVPAGLAPSDSESGLAMSSPFMALRHRNFRLLWSSQLVSMAGSMMQSTALLWHVSLLAPPDRRGIALGMV